MFAATKDELKLSFVNKEGIPWRVPVNGQEIGLQKVRTHLRIPLEMNDGVYWPHIHFLRRRAPAPK